MVSDKLFLFITVLLALNFVQGISSRVTVRDVTSSKANLLRLLEDEIIPGYQTCIDADADRRIARGVASLERAVPLELRFPQNLSLLQGSWKLLYTNNAPRPLPRSLNDVIPSFGISTTPYQIIDTYQRRLTNCIQIDALADESIGETLLKRVPFIGNALVSSYVRLDLEHSFEYEPNSPRISIILRRVQRQLDGRGLDDVPPPLRALFFDTASLQVPNVVATVNDRFGGSAGTFVTTFCDDSLRISRGSRELRIFERCQPADIWPPIRTLSPSSQVQTDQRINPL